MAPQIIDNPSVTFMHLIPQTQAIKKMMISAFEESTSYFEGVPGMTSPLCGPGWILIVNSAVSFDPLSGDGVGNALKGSILLVAVINAIASGFSSDRCLAHYALRLRTECLSHIKECLRYYSEWSSSSYWIDEIQQMKNALSQISLGNEDFIFGLKDFKLTRLYE